MDKYIRLNHTVEGHNVVPLSLFQDPKQLAEVLSKYPDDDWYTSLYTFPPDIKTHFEASGGKIKGYSGTAFTNKLFFDIDCKNDLELAKNQTLEILHRLNNDIPNIQEYCRVFFSGSKGFHLELTLNKEFTPEEMKIICTNIAGDFETFDPVIYNTTRLIRLVNTRHQKSGLFKIEMTPEDLVELSIQQIQEKAKSRNTLEFTPKVIEDLAFLDKYSKPKNKTYKQVVVSTTESEDGVRGLDTIDFVKCPKTKPRCIHALEHGIMVPGIGERNQTFLRLAAYYRNQGFTKEVAFNTLKGIARENARLYPEHEAFTKEEIWNTVISSVYTEGSNWKTIPGAVGTDPENALLKKYCNVLDKYTNRQCTLHAKVNTEKTSMQIDEVFESFNTFAENFEKNVVKTGINFVDKYMKITTGTTTLLVGAAGSGKTTLCLNMMEQANGLNQATMFFSMDMHKNLIYLKLAQKLTNYNQDQIFAFHRNGDTKKITEIKQLIAAKYNKTIFDFSGTLTLEQMRDKVFEAEQKMGEKIKFVVVDYAGRISSQFSDTYANARHNALKSKEIADVTDSAWIILSQISRNVGDGCSPLRTKRAAKESGDWEESATNVITVWRPFMGDPDRDDVMRLFLAKNRMGAELESPLLWDGAKGIIRDMTDDELAVYSESRGDKAEKEYMKAKSGKMLT